MSSARASALYGSLNADAVAARPVTAAGGSTAAGTSAAGSTATRWALPAVRRPPVLGVFAATGTDDTAGAAGVTAAPAAAARAELRVTRAGVTIGAGATEGSTSSLSSSPLFPALRVRAAGVAPRRRDAVLGGTGVTALATTGFTSSTCCTGAASTTATAQGATGSHSTTGAETAAGEAAGAGGGAGGWATAGVCTLAVFSRSGGVSHAGSTGSAASAFTPAFSLHALGLLAACLGVAKVNSVGGAALAGDSAASSELAPDSMTTSRARPRGLGKNGKARCGVLLGFEAGTNGDASAPKAEEDVTSNRSPRLGRNTLFTGILDVDGRVKREEGRARHWRTVEQTVRDDVAASEPTPL